MGLVWKIDAKIPPPEQVTPIHAIVVGMDQREAGLKQREEEMRLREEGLQKKEQELSQRERDLGRREEEQRRGRLDVVVGDVGGR